MDYTVIAAVTREEGGPKLSPPIWLEKHCVLIYADTEDSTPCSASIPLHTHTD